MVGISHKVVTHRVAVAEARVALPAAVARALRASGHRTAKGPIFDTAIIAGVMAVKRTADIIPFCHPLPIEHCQIDIAQVQASKIQSGVGADHGAGKGARHELQIRCRVETRHKTGVEMEALTGASVAALTIYDMCKALSHEIRIVEIRLVHKSGGRRAVGVPA